MSGKLVPQKQQEPAVLTVSEIRCRVEELAEDIVQRMGPSHFENVEEGRQAYPLDTMIFIRLMSAHMAPN